MKIDDVVKQIDLELSWLNEEDADQVSYSLGEVIGIYEGIKKMLQKV